MTQQTRRAFLGTSFATLGGLFLPVPAFAAGRPNLKLGVLSDIHIGARAGGHAADTETRLEKALRWLDAEGADAIAVTGDIAHSGLIRELETFAAIWKKVFPQDRGHDGRTVTRLFVTGNHDLAAFWVKGDDARLTQILFNHRDNPRMVWKRLFDEEFEPIWKKCVKGYTFVGSQWPTGKDDPPVEDWFRKHANELRGDKPFFYLQHAHPKGTCGDGKISTDDGRATRALSPFPNAIALSGHSHQTLTDDSAVWQGAFTSINAGCLRAGSNDRSRSVYDSCHPFYTKGKALNRMMPLNGFEGGCGLLIDVFDSHLRIRRQSLAYDRPLDADWIVPLPARPNGEFDPKNQLAACVGPAFPAGAKLEAKVCSLAPESIVGPALAGKPCVHLRIPHAQTMKPGSRVYDYEIKLVSDGKTLVTRIVLANGYNVPESQADRVSDCLFGLDELPASGECRFVVRPRTAFGRAGNPLEAILAKDAKNN